jgi:hypothetical protein
MAAGQRVAGDFWYSKKKKPLTGKLEIKFWKQDNNKLQKISK